ncbi:FAD-dependent oxidoreductase [Streptomyces hebeiensis]
MRRVVTVGASAAGLAAAQTLRREGFDGYIGLVGREPHLPYARPPLSKQVLRGDRDAERLDGSGPRLVDGAVGDQYSAAAPGIQLLDQVLEAAAEHGLLKAGGRARTDSTIVLSAARQVNGLVRLGETLRAVLNTVASLKPKWLAAWAPPEWFDRYAIRFEDTRLPEGKIKQTELIEQIRAEPMPTTRRCASCSAPSRSRLSSTSMPSARRPGRTGKRLPTLPGTHPRPPPIAEPPGEDPALAPPDTGGHDPRAAADPAGRPLIDKLPSVRSPPWPASSAGPDASPANRLRRPGAGRGRRRPSRPGTAASQRPGAYLAFVGMAEFPPRPPHPHRPKRP